MIELTIREGMLAFSLLLIIGTCILYVISYFQERARSWEASRHRLGYCQQCHGTFIIPRHHLIVRCPECGSTNVDSSGKNTHGKGRLL